MRINGDLIAQFRNDAGLTQEALAKIAKMSVWTLRYYENNNGSSVSQGLYKIAKALNKDIELFVIENEDVELWEN